MRNVAFVLCATAVCLNASWLIADDDRESRIKEFVERCEAYRQERLKALPQQIKDQSLNLAWLRKGLIKKGRDGVLVPDPLRKVAAEFPSKESKLEHIKEAEDRLKELKAIQQRLITNDEPVIASVAYDRMLQVGDMGRLADNNVRVLQVIDKDNLLVERTYYIQGWTTVNGLPFKDVKSRQQTIWLKGFSTEGITDRTGWTVPKSIEVTGTKTYDTAAGTNTVFVVEPFDANAVLAAVKKDTAPAVEKKPKVPEKKPDVHDQLNAAPNN
jgi:hypothetical protein